MRHRSSSPSECETFLLCSGTVQPVQKAGDSMVMVQFLGAVDMPVVVERQVPGNSRCLQLWSSTVAACWQSGRRLGGGRRFAAAFRPGVGAQHTGELN